MWVKSEGGKEGERNKDEGRRERRREEEGTEGKKPIWRSECMDGGRNGCKKICLKDDEDN